MPWDELDSDEEPAEEQKWESKQEEVKARSKRNSQRPSFRRSSLSSMPVIGEDQTVDHEASVEQEREALIDLFSALDGKNWKTKDNWCSDMPLEDWHGIKIVSGRVEEINLVNNRMRGVIPESIESLEMLRKLKMDENFLSGKIPEALGRCTALEGIWLNDNELTGELPESMVDLNQLRQLNLSENGLTGSFPENWADLSSIESIVIWGNRLSGRLPWNYASEAPGLRYLDLRNNKFKEEEKDVIMEVFGKHIPSHNLSL
jgi:hypothetical protein